MKPTKLIKVIFLIIGCLIILTGVAIFLFYKFYSPVKVLAAQPSSATNVNSVTSQKENISGKLSLVIPKIKINTVLEQVDLTPLGLVDVPKSLLKAAWFDLSVKPGLAGNAVIVGHSGWKMGVPALFNNLSKLQKGDKIYINNDNGESITFVIQKLQRYDQNLKVPEIFIASDDKAHLNLITCDGIWDNVTKSYPERLVIFADKE